MLRIFLALLVFSSISHASPTFYGTGSIEGYPIEMILSIDDHGVVKGKYLYIKTNFPIPLKGLIREERIELDTFDHTSIKEKFQGNIIFKNNTIVRISGVWIGNYGSSEKSKEYAFNVSSGKDPFDDQSITCEEMENAPELIFKSIDLGSGFGSPIEVDYQCPKSLSKLEFVQPILKLSGYIRDPVYLPQICTGSIIHAQFRYFHFSLAWLGYYPEKFEFNPRKNNAMKYFEEWSYQSLYNREIYEQYIEESNHVRPLLSEWYLKNYQIDGKTADEYADLAIDVISSWGFGSYYYDWSEESVVRGTSEALMGSYQNFIKNLQYSNDEEKINSLRRLIVHNQDIKIVEKVIDSISKKTLKYRTETPLSLAVNKPKLLSILLDKGFDADHQNEFGKTALFYAIQFNAREAVKLLLEYGADVNHKYQVENPEDWKWRCSAINQWNRTPVMHAAQHADVQMLELLISYGANLEDKDVLGNGTLEYAVDSGNTDNINYIAAQLNSSLSGKTSKGE